MGALQYHHHHQPQIFMTPISFAFNLRAAATTTTLCLRSKCFFAKLCTSSTTSTSSSRSRTINKVSADELKEQWLSSLSCLPPLLKQNDNDDSPPWVIGIDPDVSGALAVLKTYNNNNDLDLGSSAAAAAAEVYDSPNVKVLIGNRIRRRMDTNAMVDLLRSLSIPTGTTAYIEQSLPHPGDGKQGWWSGGFNYGLWIGVLVASGVSVVPVPSMRWKQEFKLSGNGKTKDDSRALACSLFPSLSSSLKRKKDHGRAEALLIAAYGKGIRLNSDSESKVMSIGTDNSTL